MRRSRRTVRVFTYLTGQYDNLGDALLRREMLSLLREAGTWYVYIGKAPPDYIDALGLPSSAHTYRSYVRWYVRALADLAFRKRVAFMINPGEISSTRIELAHGLLSSLLLLVARIRGHAGIRAGVGARDRRRPLSLGHEFATRLASVNVWRDAQSREIYGRGVVAPDWAFAAETSIGGQARALPPARDTVVLSYRSDKPVPSDPTFESIKDWCAVRDLRLVLASQVERDVIHHQLLSERLGIEHVDIPSGLLDETERILRPLYARARLVISNRIHVLILAMSEGASPGSIAAHPDVKVGRTLRAAGIDLNAIAPDFSPDDVAEYLDYALETGDAHIDSFSRARESLRRLSEEIRVHIQSGSRARRTEIST